MNNDTDRIIAAISVARNYIITLLIAIIWILVGILLTAINSKASTILNITEPAYEIGMPPAPPPDVQYWHTMHVPTEGGVLPVEVFAPKLYAVMAKGEVGVGTDVPELRRGWVLVGFILLVLAIKAAWKDAGLR